VATDVSHTEVYGLSTAQLQTFFQEYPNLEAKLSTRVRLAANAEAERKRKLKMKSIFPEIDDEYIEHLAKRLTPRPQAPRHSSVDAQNLEDKPEDKSEQGDSGSSVPQPDGQTTPPATPPPTRLRRQLSSQIASQSLSDHFSLLAQSSFLTSNFCLPNEVKQHGPSGAWTLEKMFVENMDAGTETLSISTVQELLKPHRYWLISPTLREADYFAFIRDTFDKDRSGTVRAMPLPVTSITIRSLD
jgi:hypothetical protein